MARWLSAFVAVLAVLGLSVVGVQLGTAFMDAPRGSKLDLQARP